VEAWTWLAGCRARYLERSLTKLQPGINFPPPWRPQLPQCLRCPLSLVGLHTTVTQLSPQSTYKGRLTSLQRSPVLIGSCRLCRQRPFTAPFLDGSNATALPVTAAPALPTVAPTCVCDSCKQISLTGLYREPLELQICRVA
jgi:hypothetical protein